MRDNDGSKLHLIVLIVAEVRPKNNLSILYSAGYANDDHRALHCECDAYVREWRIGIDSLVRTSTINSPHGVINNTGMFCCIRRTIT